MWPWLVGSGLFELAYFALLAAAYRRAPLSVVYPIARGGAPVLVLAVSVLRSGTAPARARSAASRSSSAGVLLVRGLGRADAGGLAFGVAIACCIAGYTLIDKNGIRHASPITYLELSMARPDVAYAGAVARAKGVGAIRAAVGPPAVVAGIATFVAYAFVLAALERASAASRRRRARDERRHRRRRSPLSC